MDRHGRRSTAAEHPHEQDLYITEEAEVDPETGAFRLDDAGNVVLLGRGVLIRWDELEYLTFTELVGAGIGLEESDVAQEKEEEEV